MCPSENRSEPLARASSAPIASSTWLGWATPANEVSARRWFVGGSDALRALVRRTFLEFGVATYRKSEVSPGGELSQIYMKAPSFHIIDHVIYHTTLDTADLVPAWGIEAATRAFLKIIDNVNTMTKEEIAAVPKDLADPTRPVR